MSQLTGKTRVRLGWRGKLVLQVQVTGLFTCNIGGQIDNERRTWWRDADLCDVSIPWVMKGMENG